MMQPTERESDGRRLARKPEMLEDAACDEGVGDHCDELAPPAAVLALQDGSSDTVASPSLRRWSSWVAWESLDMAVD